MKKIRLLTIFSIMFMLLLSLSALTACGHKHDFSGQVLMDKYLAIAASCTNKATYYYSCECGEKGESTFEFGDYVHDYSQKVESSQYVASEGNCFKKGIYFYSCKCGKKGTDVFECENYDHELGADQNCYVCQNPPTIGLDYQLNEDGQSYYVAGTGIAGDVDIVIAPYYNNLPVTNVGAYAFELGWYESVIIHDGITSIDRFAFVDCYSLESIILPNTLKSIGESAFYNCDSLKSIVIPDSVTNIEDNAFIFCRSLTSINIGDGVTNIGKYAFGDTGYYNNQSNWENGVLYLGKYLLETNEISGTYNVKTGTMLIADSAFSNCSDLTSITLPDSVTSIGSYAFYSCHSLESMKIPNSVTSIGDGAFCGCTGLKRITLSDNVTSIGGNAFNNCYSLEGITIPDNVTSIGGNAFYNCYSLEGITIPDSVTSIGKGAFFGCSGLTSIYVFLNNTAYKSIDGNLYSKDGKAFIKYAQAKEATSFEIPDSVEIIGENAFSGCDGLTNIIIPDSVEIIGENAFSGCDGLTNIIIPDSVEIIGENAFSECVGLTNIIIPDSVESIGISAFLNCYGLTKINLPFIGQSKDSVENTHFGYIFGADEYGDNRYYVPSSLKEVTIKFATKISTGAFFNCSSIISITMPDTVESIEKSAFAGCNSLDSLTIPESVTSIAGGAFMDCNSLTSIDVDINNKVYRSEENCIIQKDTNTLIAGCNNGIIPEGVTALGSYAFAYCDLTGITIPDSVTSIGSYAFAYCELTNITVPDSVEYIGSNVFAYCNDLTRITVPFIGESIDNASDIVYFFDTYNYVPYSLKEIIITAATQIKASAFEYCEFLESISLPDSVVEIGEDAFYYCSALTSVTIGSGVKSIGDSAFFNCRALTTVYYKGTAAEWDEISIGSNNNPLTNATVYYYSESEPELNEDSSAYDGNYWHYDTDGVTPIIWTKQD